MSHVCIFSGNNLFVNKIAFARKLEFVFVFCLKILYSTCLISLSLCTLCDCCWILIGYSISCDCCILIGQTMVLSYLMRAFGYKYTIITGLVLQAIQLFIYGIWTTPWLMWVAGVMAALSTIIYPSKLLD